MKFPLSIFMKLAARPLDGPVPEPDRQDKLAYGKYLAKVSGCQFCHTPVDKQHQPIPGQEFARRPGVPRPVGRPALVQPDPTRHAAWAIATEAQFVGMFKAFDMPVADLPEVTAGAEHGDALADPGQADRGRPRGHLRLPEDRAPHRPGGGEAPQADRDRWPGGGRRFTSGPLM